MSLIVANWKMNLNSEKGIALAKQIVDFVSLSGFQKDVVVCPPFTMLNSIRKITEGSSVSLGAQDCGMDQYGSYTGDISASMIRECGCEYVILGHSERRLYHNETSSIVNRKVEMAMVAGLNAVVCVGESEQEYKQGLTFEVLKQQIENSIPMALDGRNLIIAYEPIWAIGSNKIPEMTEISKVVDFIGALCESTFSFEKNPLILYGGSVNPSNSKEINSIAGLGGVLVGGASLIAKDFKAIVNAV